MTLHVTTGVRAAAPARPLETPWGPSQGEEKLADGVVFHSTSSHGGIHLDAAHNEQVHPAWRAENGWYEEDSEWAIVAITFPDLYPSRQVGRAHAIAICYMPDQYEAATGRLIPDGVSQAREDARYLKQNADRFIVRSAIFSKQIPGFVECIATKGGQPTARETRFLVPSAEYEARGRHFVIDDAQHAVYDGPSSFAGYSVR